MNTIVAEDVERYAEAHTTPPPSFLARLAQETRATLPIPGMLTGTVEGRLLAPPGGMTVAVTERHAAAPRLTIPGGTRRGASPRPSLSRIGPTRYGQAPLTMVPPGPLTR